MLHFYYLWLHNPKDHLVESPEILIKRYYEIIPRSFSTKLELFLFSKCHYERNIGNITWSEFKWFTITDDLVKVYLKAWTLDYEERLSKEGLTMQEIDDMIKVWPKDNTSLQAELLEQYRLNFITVLFPFSNFEKIFDPDPEKRICHYCHISDKEIELLEARGQIKTKRDRGYTMEIDRIKPNYEYFKDNVVLACYWCNNAKSDEFTSKEFSNHIGPGIGKVWEERISEQSIKINQVQIKI